MEKYLKPKVKPDNTVIIHPLKSYTKEEVLTCLKQLNPINLNILIEWIEETL